MIGVVRRILDDMMLDPNNHNITHEALCTLLAEGTAIVNSRPITFVSTDPDSPLVLTPSDKCEFMCNEFNRKDMLKSAWRVSKPVFEALAVRIPSSVTSAQEVGGNRP